MRCGKWIALRPLEVLTVHEISAPSEWSCCFQLVPRSTLLAQFTLIGSLRVIKAIHAKEKCSKEIILTFGVRKCCGILFAVLLPSTPIMQLVKLNKKIPSTEVEDYGGQDYYEWNRVELHQQRASGFLNTSKKEIKKRSQRL